MVATYESPHTNRPIEPHDHRRVDFSDINIAGTFYYLCLVLDGCPRAILSRDIRSARKEAATEIVLQRAHEAYPCFCPRIITGKGAPFVVKDCKSFIRHFKTSEVFTSPHYPQSDGKIERCHRTLKEQAFPPKTPLPIDDAKPITNIAPADRLANRHRPIFQQGHLKLEAARKIRKRIRQQFAAAAA